MQIYTWKLKRAFCFELSCWIELNCLDKFGWWNLNTLPRLDLKIRLIIESELHELTKQNEPTLRTEPLLKTYIVKSKSLLKVVCLCLIARRSVLCGACRCLWLFLCSPWGQCPFTFCGGVTRHQAPALILSVLLDQQRTFHRQVGRSGSGLWLGLPFQQLIPDPQSITFLLWWSWRFVDSLSHPNQHSMTDHFENF